MDVTADDAALWISGIALTFTLASFWYLHARRGKLQASNPRVYAFVLASDLVLRLPFVIYNTGARALVVDDLRVTFAEDPSRAPLRWDAVVDVIRPGTPEQQRRAFATPFAVPGRSTSDLIAEFGERTTTWTPEPVTKYRLRVQAQIHPREKWKTLCEFDWWSPISAEVMKSYIAHRNERVAEPLD